MLKRGCWLALVFLATLWLSAPWATSQPDGAIPAYHASPPPKAGKLPPILTRDQLWGEDAQNPYQTHAYELAAKIPAVIYQQPCYCYCDRIGHKSLHSCFENAHGARCDICLKELYYSSRSTRRARPQPRYVRESLPVIGGPSTLSPPRLQIEDWLIRVARRMVFHRTDFGSWYGATQVSPGRPRSGSTTAHII